MNDLYVYICYLFYSTTSFKYNKCHSFTHASTPAGCRTINEKIINIQLCKNMMVVKMSQDHSEAQSRHKMSLLGVSGEMIKVFFDSMSLILVNFRIKFMS